MPWRGSSHSREIIKRTTCHQCSCAALVVFYQALCLLPNQFFLNDWFCFRSGTFVKVSVFQHPKHSAPEIPSKPRLRYLWARSSSSCNRFSALRRYSVTLQFAFLENDWLAASSRVHMQPQCTYQQLLGLRVVEFASLSKKFVFEVLARVCGANGSRYEQKTRAHHSVEIQIIYINLDQHAQTGSQLLAIHPDN